MELSMLRTTTASELVARDLTQNLTSSGSGAGGSWTENAFDDWWNFLEAFIALICIVTGLFNLWVFFRRKVYKSWSSASILLSCTVLLFVRCVFLIFFAMADNI